MRIGVILDARQDAWKLAELSQLAESYGIHSVWLSNLMNSKDTFVNLSLAAASTKRIELGTIAISPYELHPLMMTMSLMTLNEISKGRAVIAVGGGGAVARNIGVGDPSKMKPVATVRECVEIIKQISTGKKVAYRGKIFRVQSFQGNWASNPGPVVYVGANKPRMLRMACEVSDGVMMTDIPPGYVGTIVKQIKDGLSAAERNLSSFRINNFYAWHVKNDYNTALDEAKRYLLVRGPWRPEIAKIIGLTEEERKLVVKNIWNLLRYMTEGIPPKEIPEELLAKIVEGITIIGQENKLDECVETLHKFERMGLNEIALRVYGDAAPSIKLLGQQVLPQLR